MPKIIKNDKIISDDWQLLAKDATLEEMGNNPVIIPLNLWQSAKEQLTGREQLGIWLDSDESPESIATDLDNFQLIAINFPVFADGRGYSYARVLREEYNYSGELRAIGDVLRDQLFFLMRCGFDAFAIREDRDATDALASLTDFSDSYQIAVDQPVPLFRRR
ncbi:MAG: DUF934 domain-containing protein [Pseudomonadales bacterium]